MLGDRKTFHFSEFSCPTSITLKESLLEVDRVGDEDSFAFAANGNADSNDAARPVAPSLRASRRLKGLLILVPSLAVMVFVILFLLNLLGAGFIAAGDQCNFSVKLAHVFLHRLRLAQ
jgi:hypothetical protein